MNPSGVYRGIVACSREFGIDRVTVYGYLAPAGEAEPEKAEK